ncbi:hypothetical protein M9435_005217 [Picochlorum sp. BPE23]|nr:hypothetical protein M9435_005217 [Picochlorum sp. BPE23]
MGEQREDASLGGAELYTSGKDEMFRPSESIPVPVDAFRSTDHHSTHTILDACDGDGLIISPKDPSTFFLDDDGGDGLLDGLGPNFDTDIALLGMNNQNNGDFLKEREYSGGFPPIPEHSELGGMMHQMDERPLQGHVEFSQEQFAMAHDVIPQHNFQKDDFGVRYTAGATKRESAGVHKVASMPNFSLHQQGQGAQQDVAQTEDVARPRLPPKSYSTNDLSSLAQKYDVPHSHFLTAPHLRKGKGGRQPAMDPRMDPNIDPKKARRILANRLSAAKSKMRQKSAIENLKAKMQALESKKKSLMEEIASLKEKCEIEKAENTKLREALQNRT